MEVDFTKYVKDGHALILELDATENIDGKITGIDINKLISFLQYNTNITELALKNGCIDTGPVEDLVYSPHLKNLKICCESSDKRKEERMAKSKVN